MLGHLGVNVADLAAARRYYADLMPLVGFELYLDTDDQFAFRPVAGKPGTHLFFYPATETGEYSQHRPGLQHLAFVAKTRAGVRAVHAWAQQRAAVIVHEPQSFPQYPPPYFATFWLDPFGVLLEAVCHHDRD